MGGWGQMRKRTDQTSLPCMMIRDRVKCEMLRERRRLTILFFVFFFLFICAWVEKVVGGGLVDETTLTAHHSKEALYEPSPAHRNRIPNSSHRLIPQRPKQPPSALHPTQPSPHILHRLQVPPRRSHIHPRARTRDNRRHSRRCRRA
jgi:hypothetical protein